MNGFTKYDYTDEYTYILEIWGDENIVCPDVQINLAELCHLCFSLHYILSHKNCTKRLKRPFATSWCYIHLNIPSNASILDRNMSDCSF